MQEKKSEVCDNFYMHLHHCNKRVRAYNTTASSVSCAMIFAIGMSEVNVYQTRFFKPDICYKITTSAYTFTLPKLYKTFYVMSIISSQSDIYQFGIELNKTSAFAMK